MISLSVLNFLSHVPKGARQVTASFVLFAFQVI
jgi:hypothetical protein